MNRNAVGLWKDTPITFEQFCKVHPYEVQKPDGTVLYRFSTYLCAARSVLDYANEHVDANKCKDTSLVVTDGTIIADYHQCNRDVTAYKPRFITYKH